MTPTKKGVSTNIGKNFDELLQLKEIAFILFYYIHIFVKKP